MNLNPKLLELEKKINIRSQSLRLKYLSKLKKSKEQSASAKKNIGCSNFAHAFASCSSHQQREATEGSKVIGIVSAYNDMLSAHAPLKDYPDLIKLAASDKGALASVARGVPAPSFLEVPCFWDRQAEASSCRFEAFPLVCLLISSWGLQCCCSYSY